MSARITEVPTELLLDGLAGVGQRLRIEGWIHRARGDEALVAALARDAHRVVVAFACVAAQILDVQTTWLDAPVYGEREGLEAVDELHRRSAAALERLPPEVRLPLTASLEGLRASARAALKLEGRR